MVGVLVSAGVGGWVHRRAIRSWVLLLLPVAVFTLLHAVFIGSVRYRIPVMPMVIVLSAAGAGWMRERLRVRAPGRTA